MDFLFCKSENKKYSRRQFAFDAKSQRWRVLLPDPLWRLIGVFEGHLEEANWEVLVHLSCDPQPCVFDPY